ncbi:hypothetical protein F5B18DRAFT_648300 [Nemania serpens]|nr:hypothetical protein F5B18DRAFT_648300 [Nemania serpens]
MSYETSSVQRIGLTRLSRIDSDEARLPKVNIIFVHGLRGHPQTTWEHRQREAHERTAETSRRRHRFTAIFRPGRIASNRASVNEDGIKNSRELSREHRVFWPRDYLLEDVSEADIWTYGYNADVIGGLFQANNQNSVSQHGRDLSVKLEREIQNEVPIIFVAHSLGGIVVKDAIHRSEICQSQTKLVIFLGTPHRGSSSAGWGVIASNLASLAFQDSNKQIVRALETNSEVLDNIHDEFLKIAQRANMKVHSFQEARAITGIVDEYSSKVGLPLLETVESIDANHMDIAKCEDKTDPRYQAVVGVLKQFIRYHMLSGDEIRAQGSGPTTQIESRSGLSSAPVERSRHYLPLPKNKRFTGRQAILRELQDRLFVRKECQKLAIFGLGGVGKTQVVLQLAYWVKESQLDYSVFWVPAQSGVSFEQAYTEMARQLDIPVKVDEGLRKSVRRYLESEKAGKWLLIIDNADDMETLLGSSDKIGGIYDYLPESDNGLVLFTTRSRKVAVAAAGRDILDLHEMSEGEATEFLNKTLIDAEQPQDEATVNDLLKELAYLPLAIAQAANYLNENQMPIQKYLGLLRNTEQDLIGLLTKEFHDNTRYRESHNAVATTWLVSFDQIRLSNSTAAELLSFMSYIEPKGIPLSILPRPPEDWEMETAIGTLCGYAFLVRRGDSDTFDMHRLVHVTTRVWIRKHSLVYKTESSAIRHLTSIFPFSRKEDRPLWREYMPHAQHALWVNQQYQDRERFDLFYSVGRCLYADRRFQEAIIALEETVRWRKQYLLEEDHSRLASEHQLASAYLNNRQIREAIELLEHVVDIDEGLDMSDEDRRMSQDLLTEARSMLETN